MFFVFQPFEDFLIEGFPAFGFFIEIGKVLVVFLFGQVVFFQDGARGVYKDWIRGGKTFP